VALVVGRMKVVVQALLLLVLIVRHHVLLHLGVAVVRRSVVVGMRHARMHSLRLVVRLGGGKTHGILTVASSIVRRLLVFCVLSSVLPRDRRRSLLAGVPAAQTSASWHGVTMMCGRDIFATICVDSKTAGWAASGPSEMQTDRRPARVT